MKQFFGIVVAMVLFWSSSARADFRIYGTAQITNNPVASNTMTIGTNVLTWLSGITNSASQILLTNTTGGNATNLSLVLGSFTISNVTFVSITNGTYVTVVGQVNSNLTITTVGSYARITYQTSSIPAAQSVSYPFTRESAGVRSAWADGTVTGLMAYASMKFSRATPMLSYYQDDSTAQSVSNKSAWFFNFFNATNGGTFYAPTGSMISITAADEFDNGGLYAASGNAGIYFDSFGLSGRTARIAGFNSYDPIPSLFRADPTGTDQTNFFDLGGHIAQTTLTSTLSNKFSTQLAFLLNFGSALEYFPLVGDFGLGTSNRYTSANTFAADAGATFNVEAPARLTGATTIMGLTVSSMTVSNLTNAGTIRGGVIEGPLVQNGTASNMTAISETLKGSKTSGNFDLTSDLAYGATNFTSLINGNNISVDFGSNVLVRLAGTMSADGSICGIVNGRRGKQYVLFNDQPYTVFLAQNTADPIQTNRFFHKWTSGDLGIPPYGWSHISYDITSLRWSVSWIYPAVAQATNAAGNFNGSATNLSVWPGASNVVGLIVYSLTNQTTNMLEFQNSTAKIMSAFGPAGGLHIGGGSAVGASNLVVEGTGAFNGGISGGLNVPSGLSASALTNTSLTASRLLASDANKAESSVSLSNGQLPIGNGGGYTAATLMPGNAMSVTNRAGGIDLAVSPGFFMDDYAKSRTVVWLANQASVVTIGGSSPTTVNIAVAMPDGTTGLGWLMTNDATGTFSASTMIDATAASWGWGHSIRFKAVFTHYNTNVGMIFNFGFTTASSAATMNTNQPVTTPFVMCRASSSAPDTTYKLVSSDGGVSYATSDSLFAIDNTPLKEIWIDYNPAVSNAVLFTNGVAAVTNTTFLPATNQNLRAFMCSKTLDGAAKSNKVEVAIMQQARR